VSPMARQLVGGKVISQEWTLKCIELSRLYVSATITAKEFRYDFCAAYNQAAKAKEMPEEHVEELAHDIFFEISHHCLSWEEPLPWQIDDEELRRRLVRLLAESDAREYEPDTEWKR
jgi:hypothetical protein